MKPMLASDAEIDNLKFPLLASPKLDGIRCVIADGTAKTRTLKDVPNHFIREEIGKPQYEGLDGELIVGPPSAADVWNQTTSNVMSKDKRPDFTFYVFDDFTYPHMPYYERRERAEKRVRGAGNFTFMEMHDQFVIENIDNLMMYEEHLLTEGYEGVILRDPYTPYKHGRSSAREGYLLKLKRFKDSEAIVLGFEEQMHNTNEAQTNELGRTKRSTAKAGLVGKGTLGALRVRDIHSGVEFSIGTGMDDLLREAIWRNQESWSTAIIKYKYFPVGVKDAPRHPVYLGVRDVRDL